jgi:hypothetical protein
MRLLTEALHDFAEATSDYPRLLTVVAERVANTIGDVCSVLLLSDDKQWLEGAACYDRDPDVARQYAVVSQRRISTSETTVAREVMQSGKPACIPQLDVEKFRERTTPESYELHRRIGVARRFGGATARAQRTRRHTQYRALPRRAHAARRARRRRGMQLGQPRRAGDFQ